MLQSYVRVNKILCDWDPIGVGKEIASDEYTRYIPHILSVINNEKELLCYLKHIVLNTMGLKKVNQFTINEEKELKAVCRSLISINNHHIKDE